MGYKGLEMLSSLSPWYTVCSWPTERDVPVFRQLHVPELHYRTCQPENCRDVYN